MNGRSTDYSKIVRGASSDGREQKMHRQKDKFLATKNVDGSLSQIATTFFTPSTMPDDFGLMDSFSAERVGDKIVKEKEKTIVVVENPYDYRHEITITKMDDHLDDRRSGDFGYRNSLDKLDINVSTSPSST
uniref:Uncharacterized protein n=1 Tax=Romanomermis culicivorax TaxID=13658 RepID=A0A915HY95_ROMCU